MSRPGYVDKRGSAQQRAKRRVWLLSEFDTDLGPELARCSLSLSNTCLVTVDLTSLSVDRIRPGGSYARGNIQPACKPCQDHQGGILCHGFRLTSVITGRPLRVRLLGLESS